VGSEWLQILVPVLVPVAWAGVVVGAALAARRRLAAVKAAAAALGLVAVKDPAAVFRAEGEVGGVAVAVTMTPLVVSAALPWAVAGELAVHRRLGARMRVAGAVPTGDAAFDAAVVLRAPEPVVAALAGARSRAWLLEVVRTRGTAIREGRLVRTHFWTPKTAEGVREFVEAVAATARRAPRLDALNTGRRALLERAEEVGDPAVSGHFVRRLLASYGGTPEGVAACRMALGHADPELRLLAASRLAGDGIDTLIALARDGGLGPGVRARAIAAAARSSCWPLALDALTEALGAGQPAEVVAAAADGLGLVREVAALPLLRALLEHESAAVRQAALRAIERIDHGSLEGIGGALAVAGDGAAAEGALEVSGAGGELGLLGGAKRADGAEVFGPRGGGDG
jgi:hypothetical protein